MHLLQKAQRQRQMGMIFITHDLGLASMYCQQLAVLEKGKLVESGTPRQLFTAAAEPYTRLLIGATPGLSTSLSELEQRSGLRP